MDTYGRARGRVALAEQLHPQPRAAQQPPRRERGRVDRGALAEAREIAHVDHAVILAVDVREAALRQAARHRHLAAFEVERRLAPGRALALPLRATTRSLVIAGARPAALALAHGARAGARLEAVEHRSTPAPERGGRSP